MGQAQSNYLGAGKIETGTLVEIASPRRILPIEEAEQRADAQALDGALKIADIRSRCGDMCLQQAGMDHCTEGKVNGSILACQRELQSIILQLRLSAQRAWLKLLTDLGKVDTETGATEHVSEYGKLFDTLFEHGPIQITPEILRLSHSADSTTIDDEARRLYADTRDKLIRYLVAKRLINKENDFAHDYYELILFISCFAELGALETLQSHIFESRNKTRGSALMAAVAM